ncbi:hypothetical protein CNR37_00049 [Pseudomonas phage ventosus]|uniref:Uncharacterized protein n=1 Tax=Pseudomonas phage ventosus TaxID=2048980 RepID=A0A2H4P7V0_9CAUD|nr:hypothetical protein CNR37_00049 [Pseudomonas phage ventosus]
MSIVQVRTEQVIDVSDWDKLVMDTYGRPYSFQQQAGCKPRGRERLVATSNPEYVYDFEETEVPEIVNGSEMGVSFAAWLARDPKQPLPNEKTSYSLTLWWDRNFYPTAESIAHDLVKRGVLPEGTYTIDIDW